MVCALDTGAQTLTGRYVELVDSADNLMKREIWAEAEHSIIRALKHEPANPSNWLLWSNLGVVRSHLQNYDKAIEAYAIGLAGAPKSTVLLNNRAWTYLLIDSVPDALHDLNSSLSIDSLQHWPLKMRGIILMKKGDMQGAEIDLSRALKLNEKDADILAALGDISAAKGEVNQAVKLYEKAYEIEPDADLAFRMLLLITDHGNLDHARQQTTYALARWPQDPNLHLLRALQMKKSFQTDLYEKELNIAIKYGADPLIINSLFPK